MADLGGGCRGSATPSWDDLSLSNTTGILNKICLHNQSCSYVIPLWCTPSYAKFWIRPCSSAFFSEQKLKILNVILWVQLFERDTVFIRISAQPRISAHLEYAPILKAEKFNKRPPPAHPAHLSDNQIEIELSSNNRLPQRCSFLQSSLQKPCFVPSSRFVTTIYCFVVR